MKKDALTGETSHKIESLF